MGFFRTMKTNARRALRGNWGKAILVLLIELIVTAVFSGLQRAAINTFVMQPLLSNPSSVPPPQTFEALWRIVAATHVELIIYTAFAVLSAVFVAPLSLGALRWFYLLASGKGAPISEAFYYFESWIGFFRALWYTVVINLRFFFGAVVFFAAPGAIMWLSVTFLRGDSISRTTELLSAFGIGLSAALFVLAAVLFGAYVQRWALAPYLLGEGELTVRQAIKTSIAFTKGSRFRLFLFGLSFFGWILLTVFVFPVFYTAPFIGAATAIYARYLIEKNRRRPPDGTREFVVPEPAGPLDSQE